MTISHICGYHVVLQHKWNALIRWNVSLSHSFMLVLEIEPRALSVVGKHCAAGLCPCIVSTYLFTFIYLFHVCTHRLQCVSRGQLVGDLLSFCMCALGIKPRASDLPARACVCWVHLTGPALYYISEKTPKVLSFSFWNSPLLLYIVGSFIKIWPWELWSWSELVSSGSFSII